MTQGARWRAVGVVLGLGAVYDLAFGVAILGFTRISASVLGLDVPADPLYLHLNGVFLILLAGLYAAAAREPERYRAIAPISAGGRVMGFVLFARAWLDGYPQGFFALGVADLLIAAGTVAAWWWATRLNH